LRKIGRSLLRFLALSKTAQAVFTITAKGELVQARRLTGTVG
jgi:hypothetical protein